MEAEGSSVNRIAVVGSGGAGKSTLARNLGAAIGLPVFHWDRLYWKPSWQHPTKSEWKAEVERVLSLEKWICDGDAKEFQKEIFSRAEAILFLDLKRRVCLSGVLLRQLRYWGQARPDAGHGCIEKLDRHAIKAIWNYRKNRRPVVLSNIDEQALALGKPVVMLKDRTAIADFFNHISATPGDSLYDAIADWSTMRPGVSSR